MSLFKWRKLAETAQKLGVSGYIASGVKSRIPDALVPSCIETEVQEEVFDDTSAVLFGPFSAKRFNTIQQEERHSMDTSVETIHLLRLIVANADAIIEKDISLPGIIAVGRYLRHQGNHVDFVKLNNWIARLGIRQIASFIACFLIELFDFEADELEFLSSKYRKPLVHYDRMLEEALLSERHFNRLSRLNIAFVETTHRSLTGFKKQITNIEE